MLVLKNYSVTDERHVTVSGDDASQLRAAFAVIKAHTKNYRTEARMIIIEGQGAGTVYGWLRGQVAGQMKIQ